MRATSFRVITFYAALILVSLPAVSLITGCGGGSINTADQARFTALSAASGPQSV